MVGNVLVADAAHGGDAVPVGGSELAAQPGHVDIDRTAVADVPVAPDARDEGITRVNRVRVGHEMGQEVELQVGEVQFVPVDLDQPTRPVDPDRVIEPAGVGLRGRLRPGSLGQSEPEGMDFRADAVRLHQRDRVDIRRQEDEVPDAAALGPAGGDGERAVADQLETGGRGTANGGCGNCGGHVEPLRLRGVRYGCRVFGHDRAGRRLRDGIDREGRHGACRTDPHGPEGGRGHEKGATHRGSGTGTTARIGEMPCRKALDGAADGAGDATEVNVPAAYEQRLRRGHGHILGRAADARQYFPTVPIGNGRTNHMKVFRRQEGIGAQLPCSTHSLTVNPASAPPTGH